MAKSPPRACKVQGVQRVRFLLKDCACTAKAAANTNLEVLGAENEPSSTPRKDDGDAETAFGTAAWTTYGVASGESNMAENSLSWINEADFVLHFQVFGGVTILDGRQKVYSYIDVVNELTEALWSCKVTPFWKLR